MMYLGGNFPFFFWGMLLVSDFYASYDTRPPLGVIILPAVEHLLEL